MKNEKKKIGKQRKNIVHHIAITNCQPKYVYVTGNMNNLGVMENA